LLANVALLKAGWPPLIIRASDRLQYLDALAHSDEGGDLLPLFELFVKSIDRNLLELERPDLARRLFEADLAANSDSRYQLWSGQITRFLNELRRELRPYGFDLYRLAVPPVSAMLLMEESNPSGNTWLAKVRHADGRDFLIWLGFMSFRQRDLAPMERSYPSLFFGERDRSVGSTRPYKNSFDNSPLPVDEITIVPSVVTKCALVRFGITLVEMEVDEAASNIARLFSEARATLVG